MRNWVETVVAAEEIGRNIGEEIEVQVERPVEPKVTLEAPEDLVPRSHGKEEKATRVVKRTSLRESNSFSIESGASWTEKGVVQGPGKLRQLVLKADSSDFLVSVKIDGLHYLRDTWSDLNSFTNELDAVAVYQNGSNYIFEVNDLFFRDTLSTSVVPGSSTLFDLVYMEVEQNQ